MNSHSSINHSIGTNQNIEKFVDCVEYGYDSHDGNSPISNNQKQETDQLIRRKSKNQQSESEHNKSTNKSQKDAAPKKRQSIMNNEKQKIEQAQEEDNSDEKHVNGNNQQHPVVQRIQHQSNPLKLTINDMKKRQSSRTQYDFSLGPELRHIKNQDLSNDEECHQYYQQNSPIQSFFSTKAPKSVVNNVFLQNQEQFLRPRIRSSSIDVREAVDINKN